MTTTARIGFDSTDTPVCVPVHVIGTALGGRMTRIRIIDPATVPADLFQRSIVLAMSASGALCCPAGMVD